MADDDEQERGYDNGRATSDGVITFAAVLVSVPWVGFAVAPQVAGVMPVLDVFGNLLGPVVRHGHIVFGESEDMLLTHRHQRGIHVNARASQRR